VSTESQHPVVLVTEPVVDEALEWLRARGGETILAYEGEEWQQRAAEIRAIIVRAHVVDRAQLDALPSLEIVVKHGVGVNTIDLVETTARGIVVTNVPGANMNAVAEHTVALLSALSRDLVDADAMLRSGRFAERFQMRAMQELTDTRVGIVGGGRIGRRIATILRGGYGCEIAVFDPHVDPTLVREVGGRVIDDVGELFDWAEHVVVSAPLTPETRGLVDADLLARLGPEGSLVCTSRGGIVDEEALVAALSSGAIRAAALDVWEPEPPRTDHPLFAITGTVLTPHIAFDSDKSMVRMGMDSVSQLWDLLNGRPAPIVTLDSWG
jgi:D-3-phosphoglycerate dehydrogenase